MKQFSVVAVVTALPQWKNFGKFCFAHYIHQPNLSFKPLMILELLKIMLSNAAMEINTVNKVYQFYIFIDLSSKGIRTITPRTITPPDNYPPDKYPPDNYPLGQISPGHLPPLRNFSSTYLGILCTYILHILFFLEEPNIHFMFHIINPFVYCK